MLDFLRHEEELCVALTRCTMLPESSVHAPGTKRDQGSTAEVRQHHTLHVNENNGCEGVGGVWAV